MKFNILCMPLFIEWGDILITVSAQSILMNHNICKANMFAGFSKMLDVCLLSQSYKM